MAPSKPYVWICLALCVAMGGCDVFYNKTGEVVSMDCGNADGNKHLTWFFNDELLFRVMTGVTKAKTELGKKVKIIGRTLKVPSLKITDSGKYKCTGLDVGNRRVTQEHTVYVISAFASPSETVLLSTDLTLTCDIYNSSTAQIQWMNPLNKLLSTTKSISLKSVKSTDSGNWTCRIQDNKIVENMVVEITVLGPLTSPAEVNVTDGGSADLTCSLPTASLPHVVEGGWSHDSPNGPKFPTLQGGPTWKGETNSKVTFPKGKLNNDFNVTLNKVKPTDKGKYTCTVTFKNGQSLSTSVMLKVEEKPAGAHPIKGNLWIWVGAAAAFVLLIGLIIIIVLIHRRNKRMRRKVRKLRSMRQGLTAINYCQCDRTNRQPQAGKRERPPPLPRYQYDIMD